MKPLTKIQESARGEYCTVDLVGCRMDTETTVLAHYTAQVLGSTRKHDLRACYACVECHDRLDDRTKYPWKQYEKQARWQYAISKTHVKLLEKGLIKIAGDEDQIHTTTTYKVLPRR